MVGSIPGNVSVSATGGATYSIPLSIPAGINGVQPNLGIVFNSQAGNGLLGVGCNLSGISGITRVPNNPYYDDDVYHAVSFDSNDKFALDGQRLLLVNGTYGANASTYSTENDPSTRVTYIKLSDFENYFKVETKSGSTIYYGNTSDSKVILPEQNATFNWFINRLEDSNGNYTNYNYSNYNGELLISSIEYTGNGSSLPFYRILFHYSSKNDIGFAYIDGSKLESKHLLSYIQIFYNYTLLKTYKFNYATDYFSRLTSISLENAIGEKLNPTLLSWKEKIWPLANSIRIDCYGGVMADFDNNGSVDLYALVNEGGVYYEQLFKNTNGTLVPWASKQQINAAYQVFDDVIDINGDGKMDIINIVDVKVPDIGVGITIKTSTGYSFQTKLNDFNFSPPENVKFIKICTGDFDGNGLEDIILFTRNGQEYLYTYNTSTSSIDKIVISALPAYSTETFDNWYSLKSGDFNGDGKTDIGFYNSVNSIFNVKTLQDYNLLDVYTLSSPINWMEKGDFNGDGITDVAYINYNKFDIHFVKPDGSIVETVTSMPYFEPGECDGLHEPLYCSDVFRIGFKANVFDVNMDGKEDIIYTVSTQYTIKRNDGGFFTTEDIDHLVTDFNATVYDDHATFNNGYLTYFAFGLGNGKFSFSNGRGLGFYSNLMYGDLNGDGLLDVFKKETNNTFSQLTTSYLGYKKYDLIKITDGLNNTTEIEYKSLNDQIDPIYDPNTNAVFPIRDFAGPFMVVSKITRSNGINDPIVENYNYNYGKLHLKGKGFLGFENMRITNAFTGISSVVRKKLHTNYMAMIEYQTDQYLGSTFIYKNYVDTYSFLSLGGKRYLYKADKVINYDYLNSTQSSKTFTYDAFGNILTQNTVTPDASILVTNEYDIKGAWCPSRIKNTIVTYTRGIETKSKTSSFEYYENGNLKKETVDPGDENQLMTEYGYDEFGNIVSINLTALGYTPRTKSFTYENGRFVKTSTNNLLQTTTFENNPRFGTVEKIIDFKSRTSFNQFDSWGNLILTRNAGGIYGTQALRWANGTGPQGAVFYMYAETSGSAPVLTWYDIAGNELRKETKGFNDKPVYVDTKYDEMGRVKEVSDPYYSDETPKFTSIEYDQYGRELRRTLPTGAIVNTTYGPKEVTVTGPNADITKTMNSLGETILSTDNISGQSVSYEYYANGLIKSTKPSVGPAITMEYDAQGNRTKITDPDAGIITTKYNGFGELLWQEDNMGNRTSNNYDSFGRLDFITRTNSPTTEYTYNSDNQLESISNGVHIVNYTYDIFDRIIQVNQAVGSKLFVSHTDYDAYGRVLKETYPTGYYITNLYDNNGFLNEIVDPNNSSIWKLNNISALGQILSVSKGNSKTTSYTFDLHQRPTSIKTPGIAEFEYEFDPITGNLNYRKDITLINETRRDLREDFTYDNLNRLTGGKLQGQAENYLSLNYQPNGNIESKSDAALQYSYDPNNKPNAVQTLENLTGYPQTDQSITYNAFNKINDVIEGDYKLNFSYGINDQRIITELYHSNQLIKTKYFTNNYEEEITSGDIRKIHYIAGGDGLAAVYIIDNANPEGKMYYTYTDHLGSIIAASDDSGNLLEEQSFDPWGRNRNPNNWSYENIPAFNLLDRGYTGHEHLPEFNLINMNGRMYDPILGRMLSPDKYIQLADFAQNFNRYSYCLNNPLVYIDPDGNNPLIIIAFAIAGAYLGGVATNGGELNPGSWNWQSANTYLGIIGGGALGALGGWYLCNPGNLTFMAGINTAGGSAFVVGQGADWSFEWSTAGGGGGSIPLTPSNSLSPSQLVNQQINYSIAALQRQTDYSTFDLHFVAHVLDCSLSALSQPVPISAQAAMDMINSIGATPGLDKIYVQGTGLIPGISYRNGIYSANMGPGNAITSTKGNRNSDIYVSDVAFSSKYNLYLTMGHERVHVLDYYYGKWDPSSYRSTDLSDYRAYLWEVRECAIYRAPGSAYYNINMGPNGYNKFLQLQKKYGYNIQMYNYY